MKMKFHSTPKRSDDGFTYLKGKLMKSSERIGSVRFGVPFSEVVDPDQREKVWADSHHSNAATAADPKHSTLMMWDFKGRSFSMTNSFSLLLLIVVDWNHLEFDEDRKLFFTGVYNKYLTSQKGHLHPHPHDPEQNENSLPNDNLQKGVKHSTNASRFPSSKRGVKSSGSDRISNVKYVFICGSFMILIYFHNVGLLKRLKSRRLVANRLRALLVYSETTIQQRLQTRFAPYSSKFIAA